MTHTTTGVLGMSHNKVLGYKLPEQYCENIRTVNRRTMPQSRYNQQPQGWYPFENAMNTNTMFSCLTYSGPWHEAVPEAGDSVAAQGRNVHSIVGNVAMSMMLAAPWQSHLEA